MVNAGDNGGLTLSEQSVDAASMSGLSAGEDSPAEAERIAASWRLVKPASRAERATS